MDLPDRLLWLARIPSPFGEEQKLSDEIAQTLGGLGLPAPVRRYGRSVVAPLARSAEGPKIVLVGHLDVLAGRTRGEPRREEQRLIGPGVADMKSGLALMLDLAERPPANCHLTAVFSARGTGGYHENELARVLTEDPDVASADLAVVMKPSDNKLQLGCGGTVHATFLFIGRNGHSGQLATRRTNAIHRAARILTELANMQPIPDVVDGLTWHEWMTVTSAQGGRPISMAPNELNLNIHYCIGPSTSLHDAQSRMMELAGRDAMLRFEDLAPPAAPVQGNALVDLLAQSGVRAVEARQTHTDVARFAKAGIPAVTFGPGIEAQSQQDNEWTDLAALAEGRAILDRWFELMSTPAKPRARASKSKSAALETAQPKAKATQGSAKLSIKASSKSKAASSPKASPKASPKRR